jgi:3',5'-cyclic AMP phosphodiesterase CpdA
MAKKLKELAPSAVVWNGDATNTTQKKSTAVEIFLDPPIQDRDWSADIPTLFESGNHDFRGSWISKKEEVVLPRDPSERLGSQWDLKWNFATRIGDIAAIGMDTGEDKPDGHPKWFGLANFSPYRKAQAKWLEEQFARPEIASAKHKVLFCHIPLFAAPGSRDYPHDGVVIDPHDYAYWSRECNELWGPIITRAGVELVVCGHCHRFRYDPPTADRPWAQVVGGGPELAAKDTTRFPTVVEGFVDDSGRLRLKVHDLQSKAVVFDALV